MAAGPSIESDRFQGEFEGLLGLVGPRFTRAASRRRVRSFLLGLLAGLPRANCWTVAEHAGDTNPHGMQRLLARVVWDADAVRDDLRGYVVDRLGNAGAVLVVDETGDLKKGTRTVGVQRQYTGRQAESKTRRSRCIWPMRPTGGMRSSTVLSTCPAAERMV